MRPPIDLYALLPAVYRLRDAERGEPLRALIDLVSEQAEMLRGDLDGLWDDLFVETAAEWAVPYIGDLVANSPLHEVPGLSRRADVADTIHWRRRKGTLAMLGDLARSVTGWGVHAVATFELLGWNQNLNHQRMQDGVDPKGAHPFTQERVGSVSLRGRDAVDRIGGAFETATHSVDVRTIADREGWYGLRKVCFFCFRLQSFPLRASTAFPSSSGPKRFHISPLGQDAPAFHLGAPLADGQAFATEDNVDAPIRPYRFFEHPEFEYGDGRSLLIHHGSTPVPIEHLICKDLSQWADVPAGMVGVDVRRGRIRFHPTYPLSGPVTIDASYGFSAPLGGGPYRRPEQTPPAVAPREFVVSVQHPAAGQFTTIEAAVAAWLAGPKGDVRIVIADSATYAPASGTLALDTLAVGSNPVDISIVAADEQRPVIVGDLLLKGTTVHVFTLDGVAISGAVTIEGPVQRVVVRDCTLVPGIALTPPGAPTHPERPSLVCDQPAERRDIVLQRCITGPLRLAAEANHLAISDSIVHAPLVAAPAVRVALAADDAGQVEGPSTTIERSTVVGSVHVRELTLASESLFVEGSVVADRRQSGCVRFSWVEPKDSLTPRRYRCQPDLVADAAADAAAKLRAIARVRPSFTTTHYGQPAFLQLGATCAAEILEGGEDGAEMGAFHMLQAPYRATNLRVRLDEYLPLGLEPGIVHVT